MKPRRSGRAKRAREEGAASDKSTAGTLAVATEGGVPATGACRAIAAAATPQLASGKAGTLTSWARDIVVCYTWRSIADAMRAVTRDGQQFPSESKALVYKAVAEVCRVQMRPVRRMMTIIGLQRCHGAIGEKHSALEKPEHVLKNGERPAFFF